MTARILCLIILALEIRGLSLSLTRRLWKAFVFYTQLSNMMTAVSAALLLVFGQPYPVSVLRYLSVCMMVMTFFVTTCVLVPMGGDPKKLLWSGNGLYLHVLCPVVSALSYILAEHHAGRGAIPVPVAVTLVYGLTMLCLNKKFYGVLTTDGAMAEYVSVPEKQLYALPEGTTYYQGALAEPYAVTYGAYRKAGSLKDKIVMIVGAGTIGQCLLQLVCLDQPKMVIMADLSDPRLAIAKELGATHTINTGKVDALEEISRITDGHMIDVSFEAVGVQPTANLSIKALRIAGTAVWLGMNQKQMTLNMQDIVCSARNVLGSFNYTHQEFGEVVDIIGSGKLATNRMISKVVSLEEAPQAFEDLLSSPDQYLKIIIDPTK